MDRGEINVGNLSARRATVHMAQALGGKRKRAWYAAGNPDEPVGPISLQQQGLA